MMKKTMNRMVAVSLSGIMAISMLPFTASAESGSLLVLGDSISSGYAVEEGEYAYYDYLTECMDLEMTNMAVGGYRTEDLLAHMAKEETKNAIAAADVISISIGANDLLQPFMKYLESLLEEGETYAELFQRLNAEGSLVSHITQLTGYLRSYITAAQTNIQQIEADIIALNPDVRLVMQTIYNPVEYDPAELAGTEYESSYKTLNNYVKNSLARINETILALENTMVADVAAAFVDTGWIYIRVSEVDVHPTQLGHALIGATVLDTLSVVEGESYAMRVTLDAVTEEDAVILPVDDQVLMERYAGTYYLRGDADNDTVVDTADAITALVEYTNVTVLGQESTLNGFSAHAVDVDFNGAIDSSDAIGILQYYAAKIIDDTATWDDIMPS